MLALRNPSICKRFTLTTTHGFIYDNTLPKFFFGALPEDRVLVAAPLSGLEDSTRLFFLIFWEWALPGDRVLVAARFLVCTGRFSTNEAFFFEIGLFPGTESLLLPVP